MISLMASIHPDAIIGRNVTIGPYAYIDQDVIIGDNCVIMPHACLYAGTNLGKNNKVYSGVILGAIPEGISICKHSRLLIGDNNIFREHVVVSRSSQKGAATIIGNNNYLYPNVSVSSDVTIKDNCIIQAGTAIIPFYLVEAGTKL